MLRLPARSRSRTLLTAVLLVSAATALVVPGAATAKTFVSHFQDPTGDGPSDGADLTAARVAYNRRTGAISATVTFAGPIDTTSDDSVAIAFSDLVGGRCRSPVMTIGAVFAQPDLAVAQRLKGQKAVGRVYGGVSTVEDDTITMRVKHRALAGKTVGCVVALVFRQSSGSDPKIVDVTKGDDGFNG